MYVSKVDNQNVSTYPRAIHWHEAWFEMIFVCGGRGQALIGEKMYDVSTGDILAYNSGVLHDEMCHEGLSFERLCIGIANLRIDGLPENHLVPEGTRPIVTAEGDSERTFQIWNAIFELLSGNKPDAESMAHYLMLSLLAYVQSKLNSAAVYPDMNTDGEHRLGMEARKYLDAHYAEAITLPDIGRAMNLSVYYLAHVFKKWWAMHPCSISPSGASARLRRS